MEIAAGAVVLIAFVMSLLVAYLIYEFVSKWRLQNFIEKLGDGSFPVTLSWGKDFICSFLLISIIDGGGFLKTHQEIEIETAQDGQDETILMIEGGKPRLILPALVVEQIEKVCAKTSPADYSG